MRDLSSAAAAPRSSRRSPSASTFAASTFAASTFAAALLAGGCVAPVDSADGFTEEAVGQRADGLARSGAWRVSSRARAVADPQRTPYDGAPRWSGASGCGDGLRPGAADLRNFLLRRYPQITSIGGFSCRQNTADLSRTSVHGTGRALDIFIPTHGGQADNDLGDEVAHWLIEHAASVGVQYVIWDRWQWNSSRSAGNHDREYGGPHPHHDHIHAEITLDGAARRTPWFQAPPELPPEPEPPAPRLPATCDAGTSFTPVFCDDDGTWAEDSIVYVGLQGFSTGCGQVNGKLRYCPDEPATRAQTLVMLGRAGDIPLDGHPDAFQDDTGHYGERYLNAAAAFGITRGCRADGRTVCPDEPLTRSQVAAFLRRMHMLPPASRDHFDDDAGSPFEDDHNRLAESGITSGCGTRRFCGDETVSRAHLAVFIHRAHTRGLPTPWTVETDMPTGADVDPLARTEGMESPAEMEPGPAIEPEPISETGAGAPGGEGAGEGGAGSPRTFSGGACAVPAITGDGEASHAAWFILLATLVGLRRRR